ncbi:MAG: cysteine--tRNA ligase [Campylobacterales bacterium]|nr:cysteine--tRNA ligase [Campylobacterales bacterium]
MVIFDSVKKEKVLFEPIKEKQATLYVCGPTVYDDAHLGHARSAISFDLLRRVLEASGYKTTLIRNVTDIDDKIINKAKQSSKSIQEITQFYEKRYLEDMDALLVKEPDIAPRVSESMGAIEMMIQTLLDKGYAYKISNGDIYFDTSKDASYGTISKKTSDESMSRVTHTDEKKNQRDFALWKACEDAESCFASPLGKGRPGWHIECSAMIEEYGLKDAPYSIDIHGGGADLLFPHHENEAAQSRCATNHELAKYWMHNGFVQIDGEKMSKSLGNSFFLKDALKVYDGEILRFYLAGIHYRSDFNFNEEDLLVSKKRLDKLYRLKQRVLFKGGKSSEYFTKTLLEALQDDLNISKALSVIDEMIAKANEQLDTNPKDEELKKTIGANLAYIEKLLGFGAKECTQYFQLGVSKEDKKQIEILIQERLEAKKAKDFTKADALRNTLLKMGINIMDSNTGTLWEKTP